MPESKRARHGLLSLWLALGMLVPGGAVSAAPSPPPPPEDVSGDDIFLVSTSVSPNVILLMDNSSSMNHIEWHPAFDPDDPASYGCDEFDNDTIYQASALDPTDEFCGHTRQIYDTGDPTTLYDGRYLNWYYGLDDASPILDEIENEMAEVEGCTAAGGSGPYAEKYRRTRLEMSKQVLIDLLCVAEPKNVRFGVAWFREAADAASEDPNGGFIREDLGRSNPNHAAELESAIKNTDIASETPLAESLFQIYTFWMSRDTNDIPLGRDSTPFPRYQYDKFGNWDTNSNQWLEDPMLYACEKAFVVIVTDGLPTRDDFDQDPASTAVGFAGFPGLIGDYYQPAGDETEVPGDPDETSWYLDDIAKYMYDKDFRPDLDGDQTIDTYAIGLATTQQADDFLSRTAEVGNGIFFHVKNGDELAFALIAALNDIIEKAASFTAASVPSARTIDGGDFYQSYFFPRGKSASWEGHVRAWHITANGDIHDKNDACALDDPDAGECNSGPYKPSAEYFWDAAEEVPAPASRSLYTSKIVSGVPTRVAFDTALQAADLDVAAFVNPPPDPSPNSALYPVQGSLALNAEGLTDEIVQYTRGCFFGTGVETADVDGGVPCAARPSRLGDVFHSNPVIVRQPRRPSSDASYQAFKEHYAERTRVLYAGTNGGFLEAIHAGEWQADETPPKYDAGTGEELFGFMPWQSRRTIKQFPIDDPTSRTHYVDGDPQTADVWFYPSATTATPASNGNEWRTVLLGGLREGGHHYYALDITNPDGIAGPAGTPGPGGVLPYPGYLWEFPDEIDTAGDFDSMGQTFARPVLTRVRLQVDGDTNSGRGYERWVAIVSAGYDAKSDPNPDTVTGVTSAYDAAATEGRAIFVIDVKTGEVLAEQKFESGPACLLLAPPATCEMKYSIVSTPSVFDLNYDGFADVIYVGDMGGQVFKWVIHDLGEDRVNDGSGLRTQPAWPFKLFFQAPTETIGGDVYYKNFFYPPSGAIASNKLWLAFGSGERRNLPWAGDGDSSTDEVNRFYVINDLDPLEQASPVLDTLGEADLTDITGDEDGATFVNSGYYFKVAEGEKFVTNTVIFDGKVIGSSFAPTDTSNPCTSRGNATLYVFDVRDGTGNFQDGNGDPVRGLAIGAGLPTDPKVSIGVGGKDNHVYVEKSGTDLWSEDQDDISVGGQFIYWRER